MRTILRAPAVALVLPLLASCATIVADASRSEPQARPARTADYPIAVLEDAVPARQHKVIGSVRVRVKLSETLQHMAPRTRVVAELKRQARALGGDALLSVTVTPASGGGTYLSPTGDVLAGNSEIWSALVVVWLEP